VTFQVEEGSSAQGIIYVEKREAQRIIAMYKEGGSGGDSPPAYAVPLSPPKARAKPFSLDR
jgi:hypothetical protein